MANIGKVIHKDPPRPSSGLILPRSVFDSAPERNVGQPCQSVELEQVPDELLISTMVAYGCPRWAAEEVRRNGYRRFDALRFWCMVQDAAEGDVEARAGLDRARGMWEEMRRNELIDERPEHTIGFWER